jgi:hypothetical protein
MTPTYKEIIKEIGAQIKARKKLLLLRTLIITWPVLLAIIVGYVANSLYGEQFIQSIAFSFPNIIYIAVYILFAIVYMLIVGFIFEIEKRIWIDSFFDKREISGKQSWTLAKKLLWPAIIFRFNIFFKYYFLPLILLIVALIFPILFYAYSDFDNYLNMNYIIAYMVFFLLSIVGYFIYTYFLRIKLRFSWFVFLDMYKGGKLEIQSIYEKIDLLNVTAKSEGFKKALILTVGVDSIKAITTQLIVIMTEGIKVVSMEIPGLGNAGRALGNLTQIYGQSLIKQVTSYAEIVSIYILFRTAHQQTYGKEQEINDFMYEGVDTVPHVN